jgi:hypothetical protein
MENSNKWRLNEIKSVRVSSELREMLEQEITARNTSFSQYVRYAMIMQMKHEKKQTPKAA